MKLAIIPARGGSKRIPKKNIKDFLGKPIISYSIAGALASGLFDEVMVSTEDEEISAIAVQYGAKVPFKRSTANASDFATTADVIEEVLKEYNRRGMNFETVCCIYPTAPFIMPKRLIEGYKLLIDRDYDTVAPVVKFSFPIQRSFIMTDKSQITFSFPKYLQKRSQDLIPHYHDAGQFYWMKTAAFLKNKSVWNNNTGAILLSPMEVQDIDTEEDWEVAEFKYQLNRAKAR